MQKFMAVILNDALYVGALSGEHWQPVDIVIKSGLHLTKYQRNNHQFIYSPPQLLNQELRR
ncbi:MAG: hypothetical protein CMA65_06410 [Euryarchaeota archaeon]|nr:hypothetical protein [Euryarchaeota archaeon]